MPRKSMAQMQAEHDAAMADAAANFKLATEAKDKAIAQLTDRLHKSESRNGAVDKRSAELSADNDSLRDLLHAAEMELSRREGYMQAIDDAQPPVMQPVPREKQAVRHIGDGSGSDYSTDTWSHTTRPPWWRRGRA